MINPYIVDQEKVLDTALKCVKRQAYHIYLTQEQHNLRFCLKQTKIMLNELRTDLLLPKNYYILYNSIFDEMKRIEDFMKLEISHGRRPEDIYESVQQCEFVIPRLYLTIISASNYIEKCPSKCTEILTDLLEMIRLAQNPLRGIFARFFLLQIVKDKLPDKDNIYVQEKGGNLQETVIFLVKNFEEINRLWIRLNSENNSEVEKSVKEKEREDLKPLVSETINRLSSLEGLTEELYENLVLPKLIEIVFMYNDPLSQEYIMECIIRAFPVEYNIKCIEFILLTISKLTEKTNIKLLFIIMLVKLTLYYEDIKKLNDKEEKEKLIEKTYNIYPILMRNFDIIMNNELRNENKIILDILELNISFIKYTIKCAPEKDQLNSINHILNLNVNILSFYNKLLLKNEIDKICELLSIPLESTYSIFEMPDFPKIMNVLDYDNMKKLGLSIINNLINPNSKEKINSIEKINQLIFFIRPLLKNILSPEEENDVNFEKEQNTVAKLLFVIKSEDPQILFDIYTNLKNTLFEGGKKRIKITFPALANVLIYFCQQITLSYENKQKEDDNNIFYDISKFEKDDLFYEFISKVYDLLSNVINTIGENIPQLGMKLYLLALAQINNVHIMREKLEEKSLLFFKNCVNVYKNMEKEKKYDLFIEICQKLLNVDIISKENLENIFKELFTEAKNLPKRIEQCNGLLIMSQLYYKHFKDKKKIIDCLNTAKKVADFSLTNPHNLILYVLLLNKYIYYIDVDEENLAEINNEQIEDLIEAIKNHIITIKTDKNVDACFLPEIENYFNNTIALIELRKKEENHKEIYNSLNISST